MKISTIGIGASAATLALLLGGCGTSANSIADEVCDLVSEASAAAEAGEAVEDDYFEKLEDLRKKADDAGVSDEDIEAAVEDKCGDVL
jgi:hypothetical protein